MADKKDDDQRSRSSLVTRSEAAASSVASRLSEARKKTELAKLRAAQAKRAAEAQAQLAIKKAELEAQGAADEEELLALEAKLELDEALSEAGRPASSRSVHGQRDRPGPSATPAPPAPPAPPVVRERTQNWIASLPVRSSLGDADGVLMQRPLSSPPKLQLDKYDGSPIEWPRWIALFKALIHDRPDLTDVERLAHLQSSLTGAARQALRGMLCDGRLYGEAIRELERLFGDPRHVIQATLAAVFNAPAVKESDIDALARLSGALHCAVSVLRCSDYSADLAASSNLSNVVAKLPRSVAWRWGEHAVRMRPAVPTLIDLDLWLRDYVDAGRAGQQTLDPYAAMGQTANRSNEQKLYRRSRHNVMTAGQGRCDPSTSRPESCVCCYKSHCVTSCKKFENLQTKERVNVAVSHRLCFNCLSPNHLSRDCGLASQCTVDGCNRKHHTLLHDAGRIHERRRPKESTTEPSSDAHVGTAATRRKTSVLLQVVPVIVHGPAGSRKTNALLDLGSQISLITERISDSVGLSGPTEQLCVSTVNGHENIRSRRVNFQLKTTTNGTVHQVCEARTTPTLNVSGHKINWPKEKLAWPHLVDLPLAPVTNERVDVLLGADSFQLIVPREVREGPTGTPCAVRTNLGWIGTSHVPRATREHAQVNTIQSHESELHEQVKWLWTTEAFGTKYHQPPQTSKADERALSILNETTKRAGERYETGLLWNVENVQLPDSRQAAQNRLHSVERKLSKDPKLCHAYRETMNGYIQQGHARKLSDAELQIAHDREWYLPHHAVTSPSKPDKVRVVFDAAAVSRGTSLNDNLLTGPDNLNSLVGIIMRFRQRPVPIAADVKMMFHQIQVRPEDQPSLRFLWRDMDLTRPPTTYQMQVLVFGAKSSPCSATHVLRRCAADGEVKHPEAAAAVRSRFYVDDYLDSLETVEEADSMRTSLTALLKDGGFRLTKWSSSSKDVLRQIPVEDVSETSRDLDLDESDWSKALGVFWDVGADEFRFKSADVGSPYTKRAILSRASAVFDPLGMLAPFTMRAKHILQRIWSTGYGWDEQITDEDLMNSWKDWLSELEALETFKLRRCYRPAAKQVVSCQLHIFCDASEVAYGACAYFLIRTKDGSRSCSFVFAKTRVAPLRQLSIPRLELQAAVMGVRIAETIKREHDMNIDSTVFWSDSTTVLQWLKNESRRYHTFVANRVAEIQDTTEADQWRHVPGSLNPADICSRGCHVTELSQNTWLTGPGFLLQSPDSWPADTTHIASNDSAGEVKMDNELVTCVATVDTDELVCLEKQSTWLRALRVTAWVRRFGDNCRRNVNERRLGPLTAAELQSAEHVLVKRAQTDEFGEELKALHKGSKLPRSSRLLPLTPFLDNNGLLRVGGRLAHSELTYAAKHQLILPTTHDVTRLIVTDGHRRLAHAGPEHLLTHLRQKFWILRGRATVKRYAHPCMVCRKRAATARPQLMADLPSFRMDAASPCFSHVGVDYFGPITVRKYRKTEKRYGCIFTCMVTRAVHIEVSHSLDTDSFIMAVRRMIARRGRPKHIYSDNGTNLRGGERELRQCLRQWNQSQIADGLSQEDIEWSFNPPASPHFGGAWERLVRSTKRAMAVILGPRSVDDEMLLTVLTEVEAILNGRPLTHVSTDPTDLEALTPNHFLIGRACPQLPPGIFTDGDLSSRRRWRHAQRLVDHFWQRWKKEYLPSLSTRQKWSSNNENLQIGDIVLVIDDNLPRGRWPLARVMRTFPGRDGKVRVAEVKTATGVYTRPVVRLCPLEGA